MNPREAWITVIVIAGIGFVNYVLLKIYGAKGLYLSGFLGGFVNSSAAAVELAKPLAASSVSPDVAIAALLLTIVAMFARNLMILALFSPSAVLPAAVPLTAMAVLTVFFARRAKTRLSEAPVEIQLESPVSIVRVVVFAALFLTIRSSRTLGQRYFGKFGFLAVSALGGLVSSASTSAAAATLVSHDEMRAGLAGDGVVIASIASAVDQFAHHLPQRKKSCAFSATRIANLYSLRRGGGYSDFAALCFVSLEVRRWFCC